MNHGKYICQQLKQLRRDIADQNGIELEIPECTYQGDCDGTCPRCDYELHCLESELARRQRLGKAAIVAGTVLTLASFKNANAQDTIKTVRGLPAIKVQDVEAKGTLKGVVRLKKTGEPLISCHVFVKQNDTIIAKTLTDFDGMYTIKGLAKGVYDVELHYIGQKTNVLRNINVKAHGFTICNMAMDLDTNQKMVPVITIKTDKNPSFGSTNDCGRTPVLEIDTGDLPQVGGSGRYLIGGVETHLTGTPANTSGQPLPNERPKFNDDDINLLDKKTE